MDLKRKKKLSLLAKMQGYGLCESFSGPGGMSLGLERVGFELKVAFDYDEMAVATHNANLGNRCIQADVRELDGKQLLKKMGLKKGELALFSGGPPCQGFSKQKRGAHNGDERNDLVLDYIRLIDEISPRFFLFENVAIFGQKRGEVYVKEMRNKLRNYHLTPHFFNSADYGLAQTRQRFMIIGRRKDQKASFKVPSPTVSRWNTVGNVLANLPEPPEDYSVHPKFPNHQRAKVTEINIKRFSYVPQGGGWKSIPEKYRLDCHKNVDCSAGGWTDVYGRLSWDGQCPTITGGFDSFTRGRYGHPLHDRPLTPREAARLQGFPDSFHFLGNRGDVRSQIGNAVPPPLAEAVGFEILRSLLIADGLLEDDISPSYFTEQLELLSA